MLPLFKSIFHDLLYSPEKARLMMRGFFLWAGTIGTMVGTSDFRAWTMKEWLIRCAAAGVVGAGGLIGVGEKNK